MKLHEEELNITGCYMLKWNAFVRKEIIIAFSKLKGSSYEIVFQNMTKLTVHRLEIKR